MIPMTQDGENCITPASDGSRLKHSDIGQDLWSETLSFRPPRQLPGLKRSVSHHVSLSASLPVTLHSPPRVLFLKPCTLPLR